MADIRFDKESVVADGGANGSIAALIKSTSSAAFVFILRVASAYDGDIVVSVNFNGYFRFLSPPLKNSQQSLRNTRQFSEACPP